MLAAAFALALAGLCRITAPGAVAVVRIPAALRGAYPVPRFAPEAWRVFASGVGEAAPGELARRFRLAGTLFGFGVGSAEAPQAILDDKQLVVQRLLRRGEEVLPGIRLVEVRTDAVVLEGPGVREELRIERREGPRGAEFSAAASAATDDNPAAEGTGAFGGRQVFPGRWEFDRQALLRYYTALRDEPERLLAVFDSMEPLYQDNDPQTRAILGYRLNVRGEAPFFEAMGLQPGDVVRAVNSVQMSNRRRAEDFIRAFVEDQEDAFVFELERNGNPLKQVYLIR